MFFKALLVSYLLLINFLTLAQHKGNNKSAANVILPNHFCSPASPQNSILSVKSKPSQKNTFFIPAPFKKPAIPKKYQFLDYQYIFGYTYSLNRNSAMNMHPEIGIGIGNKKFDYTTGITGTYRFLKTRKPFIYYHNKDTFSTRYFANLAFSFYFHKPFFQKNLSEAFVEIAPGFEILYLERTAQTYSQTRAYAVSFHGMGGIGFRLTKKNLRYYQIALNTNYNNFSYGKSTTIPAQFYFNFRLTFGFIVKDDWAIKRNYQK